MQCFRQMLCSLGSGPRGTNVNSVQENSQSYLCKMNPVEDEAAGICSDIALYCRIRLENRTVIKKEFFT